jgi:hypothetical protein
MTILETQTYIMMAIQQHPAPYPCLKEDVTISGLLRKKAIIHIWCMLTCRAAPASNASEAHDALPQV